METDLQFTVQPPNAMENERVIIGAILLDQENYYEAQLEPDKFYSDRHRWIYESFQRVKNSGGNIDMLTISTDLERRGLIGEVGGPAYLAEAIAAASSIWMLNPKDYTGVIEEMYTRRQMVSTANKIAQMAYETDNDILETLEKANIELQGLSTQNKTIRTSADIAGAIWEHVEKWSKTKELPGIRTGLPSLDFILNGGFQDDSLNIIAARPGKGKSGLLATNAIEADRQGKWVLFHSLEMSDEEVGARLIGQKYGIDTKRIRTGKLLEEEWDKLAEGVKWLEQSHIIIDETPAISPHYVESQARHYMARGKLDMVIVDYLQLMTGGGDTRAQQVGFCSRNLKEIAKSLHVPVVAAAQLNREIEHRSHPRPVLADLKESGDIEQDADTVTFIWNEGGEDIKGVETNPRTLSTAKHRGGSIGDVKAIMTMATTRIKEN